MGISVPSSKCYWEAETALKESKSFIEKKLRHHVTVVKCTRSEISVQ